MLIMKAAFRLFLCVFALAFVTGCAQLEQFQQTVQADFDLVTGKATVITAKEVSYVGNVFAGLQATETLYLKACKQQPTLPTCSASAYSEMIRDTYAARIARNRFIAYYNAHPDDQGGLASLLDKFKALAAAAKADAALLKT